MAALSSSQLSYGSVAINQEEVLGVGSYGKVCKAKYGQLPCAAKLLHDTMFEGGDPGIYKFVERFEQECQFLSMIKHPNIVQFLGTYPHSRRLALLMELMDESLTKYLERSPSLLPYHIQLNICHDVALALSYLHSIAIIHRDLSSNNVLLIGEGSKAKVTDFGMSKLIDVRMTPLTICPGASVYMPPEALTTPPRYSSKLDCFSHGVLTIQILTKNFPDPGDAHERIQDPRYPNRHLLCQVPETERRKKDIDLVQPDHPLLPIARSCLKINDTERPSADEVCERLAELKRKRVYTNSTVEKVIGQEAVVQRLKLELAEKNELIIKCHTQLQDKQNELIQMQDELRKHQKELEEKNQLIAQLQKGNQQKLSEKMEEKSAGKESVHATSVPDKLKEEAPPSVSVESTDFVNLEWTQKTTAPLSFLSACGTAVAHEKIVYISNYNNIFSLSLSDNEWTELPSCDYQYFGMAVLKGKLSTIGGFVTDKIQTLSPGKGWQTIYPAMLERRYGIAVTTTQTHLVVAGGQTEGGVDTNAVEVLDMNVLQWYTATCLPKAIDYPQMGISSGQIYVASSTGDTFSCFVEELLESCEPSATSNGVWTELAHIPVSDMSLATFQENVLTIGGYTDNRTPAIHCYDKSTSLICSQQFYLVMKSW